MKEYWTSLASLLGVLAFCQSLLQTVFPPELRFAFLKLASKIFHWFSSYYYFDITEIDGVNTNELYNAVQLYLSATVSITGTRLSLTRALNSSAITFGLSNNDCMVDTFNGVTVLWEHVVTQRQNQTFSWRPLPEEKRGFTLRIKKKDKFLILNSYLDFIMDKANDIRRKNQDRLLYTNSRGGSLDSRGHPWESVPFKHPSTFDTLAMDPKVKQEIMDDLKDFANGQSFYQKTGRAWKRGYLLYGPPGTGKSSMIAAMANFLGYDIYDLELTEVHTNSELRKLLMKTSSKSIIVIEDIDCSITLTNRKKNNGGGGGGGSGGILEEEYAVQGCMQPSNFFPRILPSKKSRKSKSDFGLSANNSLPELMAEPTNVRSMSFVGTHEYLAPEIIRGEGHGSAVDWWTFGIFLYELLHGTTPFKGHGNRATLFNVVGQPLKFPETPQVSPVARNLIRGLLIKEPNKRIAYKRGATEIKQHPFFEGVNWALVRCAMPPHVPEPVDFSQYVSKEASAPDKKMPDEGGNKKDSNPNDSSYVDFEYF